MDSLDDLAEVPLVLEMPAADQTAAWSDRSTNEQIDALVNVVSDLVSRVVATRARLSPFRHGHCCKYRPSEY
jgi:hypothetical protein